MTKISLSYPYPVIHMGMARFSCRLKLKRNGAAIYDSSPTCKVLISGWPDKQAGHVNDLNPNRKEKKRFGTALSPVPANVPALRVGTASAPHKPTPAAGKSHPDFGAFFPASEWENRRPRTMDGAQVSPVG